ncbi:WD40 repeat domain-containing protein [Actinobacillus equuli]|uniref:WD40 repeat domain-containing protein n=1 Tax=Actinobacillus equuli TaxID=718 RepID=UPI0024414003|nr:WD40 repeat domain-containing protein [Actinobacillus equuli]WGE74489.1 WD40 repeat domain-containing protein [Actinobacillus equuli subsp. haemolyticus]
MNKKWSFIVLAIAIIISLFIFLRPQTDPVISISVSTDGRYAISGHAPRETNSVSPKGQMVLWDIEKKTKTILSDNANSFSALFIPDSHEFMWQDQDNFMHVQNVKGEEITRFKHRHVQNHRITADKSFYLSVDFWGDIYKDYGDKLQPVYTDGGPTINPYSLSIVDDYFLSVTDTCHGSNAPVAETNLTVNPVNPSSRKKSSYDGVTLWDKHTLKPVAKLIGNCGATNGLISPDGKWVITGGENGAHYMWEIDNPNNRQVLSMPNNWELYTEEELKNDKSTPLPEKLKERPISVGTVAHAFLSEKDFIGLGRSGGKNGKGFEFAALYAAGEPWIKAYVEIGNDPSISTNYFERNLSVSSSPTAHILVTGQATGGGINVYKYHPDKMELEKIWVAD